MSGISRVYCIGPGGGFMGCDGLSSIDVLIEVHDGSRQALVVNYPNPAMKPIGDVRVIIPTGPDHPDMLLDACIAFIPGFFKGCPSLMKVRERLEGVVRMDFDFGEGVPEGWNELREEARERFKELPVYVAELIRTNEQ